MAGISPSLFEFLKELKENNNKDWFDSNKKRYQEEEQLFKTVCSDIRIGLENSDQIEKMKIYRIYKDVRFSKDKTPYKTHRSANFVREGEALRGGYFLSIADGESMIGGGFFQPAPADLLRIRKEFEIDDIPIRKIMNDSSFSKVFGSDFAPAEEVKTAPKGFSKEDPAIDLIKKKSFYFKHNFTNEEVFASNFSETVVAYYELLRPYFDYMSEILTTDLNGESLI